MIDRPEPMRATDLEFESALSFAHAHELQTALDAALSAMASYGSAHEHMVTVSLLRIVALQHQASALNRMERERSKD